MGGAGSELSGIIDSPAGDFLGCALFCHPFTSSKDLRCIVRICKRLAELGVCVLRFDFTGLGASAGNFADTNFSTNIADVHAASAYLQATTGDKPSLLMGLSFGGLACLFAASEVQTVSNVAVINTPNRPDHVLNHFREHFDIIMQQGEAQVLVAGRPMRLTAQLLEDVRNADVNTAFERLTSSVLVLHALNDDTVLYERGKCLYDQLKGVKEFVELKQADHLLTREEDAVMVAETIFNWCHFEK